MDPGLTSELDRRHRSQVEADLQDLIRGHLARRSSGRNPNWTPGTLWRRFGFLSLHVRFFSLRSTFDEVLATHELLPRAGT